MANDFLGSGLLRPFVRDGKGDFAASSGRDLIDASIGQVLGTRASSAVAQGELPWQPDAGSKLYLVKHRNNIAVTRETARAFVLEALRRWEPRVEVLDVTVVEPERINELNRLVLLITWRPIERNVDPNQVRFGPFQTEVTL